MAGSGLRQLWQPSYGSDGLTHLLAYDTIRKIISSTLPPIRILYPDHPQKFNSLFLGPKRTSGKNVMQIRSLLFK